MTDRRFCDLISGKDVVFITVKNKDYIRVRQIERLLEKNARNYAVIASEKKSPLSRMLELNNILKGWDFSGVDVIIAGFLPQLIWKEVMRCSGKESSNIKDASKEKESSPGKEEGCAVPALVADFFLSLYDTIVLDRKLIKENNPLTKRLRKMDKRVLEEADIVLTDTKADADFFAREYEIEKDKFEVLYLEADPEISASAGGKDDSYKVLYFGTGLPLQGTDIVLEAFVKAAIEHDKLQKNLSFTYIGSLKYVPLRVKNTALARKDINTIDWLPQEELYKEIESADLCIAGHFSPYIDKADRTIPGKAFIYEAFGKKMILGDTVANHEIFTEDDRHRFVRRGSAAELSRCILDFFS